MENNRQVREVTASFDDLNYFWNVNVQYDDGQQSDARLCMKTINERMGYDTPYDETSLKETLWEEAMKQMSPNMEHQRPPMNILNYPSN